MTPAMPTMRFPFASSRKSSSRSCLSHSRDWWSSRRLARGDSRGRLRSTPYTGELNCVEDLEASPGRPVARGFFSVAVYDQSSEDPGVESSVR